MLLEMFTRRSITKDNDNHDTPTPDGAPRPSTPTDRPQTGLGVTSPIVSKWRRLDHFDPQSQECSLLLRSLLESEVDRKATTSLDGGDATVVLDILAKVRVDLYCARSRSRVDFVNTDPPIP